MKLIPIEAGHFKLDGGAMFGVVPKPLWQEQYPADENNRCELATRCLLIDTGDKKILIDCGLGDKQNEKFFGFLHLFGNHSLRKSLKKAGYSTNDITDVIITHLHFDHVGGAVHKNESKETYENTFKNATYHISKSQWEWALQPNRREKASFLSENFIPLETSGKLNLFEPNDGNDFIDLLPNITIKIVNGHTVGQAIPHIKYKEKTIVYAGDFIPLQASIPIAWVPAYDTQPLVSFDEKEVFLKEAADKNYILFFEHDINVECCTVEHHKKGVRCKQSFMLKDIL